MRRTFSTLLFGALVLPGCSSSDLSCDLLADPSNCWATAALAMASCLPDEAEGTLSVDRTECTFVDGSRVVFDEPLPSSNFDLEGLAFTVEREGALCARFVDTFANRMELSAGGTEAVAELHAGSDFHLHCEGTTYEASFDRLFECAGVGAPPPTDGFLVEPALVEFSISSVSTPGVLFRCTP